MHFFDWALLALVAFAAALALRKIWRDRRAGKCCGNCTACARGPAACAPNARETAPNTPRTARGPNGGLQTKSAETRRINQ